jgi:hypothetical protein
MIQGLAGSGGWENTLARLSSSCPLVVRVVENRKDIIQARYNMFLMIFIVPV